MSPSNVTCPKLPSRFHLRRPRFSPSASPYQQMAHSSPSAKKTPSSHPGFFFLASHIQSISQPVGSAVRESSFPLLLLQPKLLSSGSSAIPAPSSPASLPPLLLPERQSLPCPLGQRLLVTPTIKANVL